MGTEYRAPRGLGVAGRRLWRSVTAVFDLAEHEAAQLEEACRCRDRLVELREVIAIDGLMIDSSQGRRLHPAIAEERAQRLALARLLATLGVPPLVEDNLPAARGVRGVYGHRGKR